jgi:DNA-binding XRE family transcriptional regulator
MARRSTEVTAAMDIFSTSGARLVVEGTVGRVQPKTEVHKPSQFFKVPVRWGKCKRLSWVDPEFLRAADGRGVDEWVSRPKISADTVWVPEATSEETEYNFGSSLRALRKARGFTQMELVSALGNTLSQTAVSNWERSRYGPSGPFVVRLAQALRVPPYAFYLPWGCARLKEEVLRLASIASVNCGGE